MFTLTISPTLTNKGFLYVFQVMLVLDTFTVCAKLYVSPNGANMSKLISNIIPDAITLLLVKVENGSIYLFIELVVLVENIKKNIDLTHTPK